MAMSVEELRDDLVGLKKEIGDKHQVLFNKIDKLADQQADMRAALAQQTAGFEHAARGHETLLGMLSKQADTITAIQVDYTPRQLDAAGIGEVKSTLAEHAKQISGMQVGLGKLATMASLIATVASLAANWLIRKMGG